MTEPTKPIDYQVAPPKGKRTKWFLIIGGLILLGLLLTTCVRGGMSLFAALSERAIATEDVARQFLQEGLPDAEDPMFARRAGIKDEQLDTLRRLMAQFGTVSDVGAANCTMNKSANTNAAESGTFADCALSAMSEHSPMNVSVKWVIEDEVWKVMGFNVNYSDNSILLDRAEQSEKKTDAEVSRAPLDDPN